jgi:PPK2 family polyphosphate:nucleotide phosphotransferase
VKIKLDDYRAPQDQNVKLKDWPTEVDRMFKSKDEYDQIMDDDIQKLRSLQSLLYAHDRYSVLLIFQAMDAAGKDGAIKHVMSGVNPQGCQVFSFKHPSAEELDHDFLWRTTRCLPERGRIGIFNRSYYEEVLIVKVHPEILASQRVPEEALQRKDFWKTRYESIVDLEKHLHRSGTQVIKFFLHISKEEQRKRFLDRIEDPEKNWKFSRTDVQERERWDDYMKAYEECISATSTEYAPWYIVPADDKRNARVIISKAVTNCLASLPLSYPVLDEERQKELKALRKLLKG